MQLQWRVHSMHYWQCIEHLQRLRPPLRGKSRWAMCHMQHHHGQDQMRYLHRRNGAKYLGSLRELPELAHLQIVLRGQVHSLYRGLSLCQRHCYLCGVHSGELRNVPQCCGHLHKVQEWLQAQFQQMRGGVTMTYKPSRHPHCRLHVAAGWLAGWLTASCISHNAVAWLPRWLPTPGLVAAALTLQCPQQPAYTLQPPEAAAEAGLCMYLHPSPRHPFSSPTHSYAE